MKKKLLVTIALIVGIGSFFSICVYIFFINLDFVGTKDSKIVQENRYRMANKLLSAEYRDGTDYCSLEIIDSVEISAGNAKGGVIIVKAYTLRNDTLVLDDTDYKDYTFADTALDVAHFVAAQKYVIKDSLMYVLDKNNIPDYIRPLKIKFNKL